MKKSLLLTACLAILAGFIYCSDGPADFTDDNGNETETEIGSAPVITFTDGIVETSKASYFISAEVISENGLKEVKITKTFPDGEYDDATDETIRAFDDPEKYSVGKTITVLDGIENMVVVISATDAEDLTTEGCFTFSVTITPPKPATQLTAAGITDALATAYAEFESTDKLPSGMVIGETACNKGGYYEAAVRLLINISKGITDDIVLKNLTAAPYPNTLDTFAEDEVPMELVLNQSERQLTYAGNAYTFANYVTYPHTFVGPEGETYNGQLSFDRSAVMLLRAFAYYKENGDFPAKLSSWQSDFLHSTTYCDITNSAVTSALSAAVSGKSTAREKAEAIFYYVRDLVEYVYYNNTTYGAAGTISGGKGNCCDTSHALIAMARAAGIPSRYVHADAKYPSGNTFGHVWAELYVDGQWWLCDATGKGNTFGNHENWNTFVLKAKHATLPF